MSDPLTGCASGCASGSSVGFGCGVLLGTTTGALVIGAASIAALVGGIKLLTLFKSMPNPQHAFWAKFTGIACVLTGGLGAAGIVGTVGLTCLSGAVCCVPCGAVGACCGTVCGSF